MAYGITYHGLCLWASGFRQQEVERLRLKVLVDYIEPRDWKKLNSEVRVGWAGFCSFGAKLELEKCQLSHGKARVQLWYLQIVEVKVRVVFLGKVGVGKSWHLPIVQSWEIWSWLGSKLWKLKLEPLDIGFSLVFWEHPLITINVLTPKSTKQKQNQANFLRFEHIPDYCNQWEDCFSVKIIYHLSMSHHDSCLPTVLSVVNWIYISLFLDLGS